ncbi:MAG: glycerol-3-phosphate ABC transporter ATP-binding protein [Phycisphaeraceae bacterium]|nr:glycerol-3-phosphate ABC transporter ATP-binding protein [Phycisphaeraceae bacterium]
MATVDLKDVVKIYPGNVKAVDNFNLDIADAEFIVFVGPSGCGKSTTLRMIAGLEEITEGTIRIGDRVVNDVPPKDRDVAMVFQNYALYPHMTVYKNMAFGLKLRKVPRREIDEKVRQAAKVLGIEELLDRKPKALSGGQRQRVAVGRAIVRDPKCFLFDEPLSNLDAKLRVEMRAELKQLHMRLKTTTVYVTHDQEEAMTLGDRVVVMKDGLIQQCQTPLEIYREPANRFVAGFVGTPPMNFFEGTVTLDGGALWFDEGTARVRLLDRMKDQLAGSVGGTLVMGVRPEAMSDEPTGRFASNDNVVEMTVNVVEPLGDKMDLYVSTAAHSHIVARIDAHRGVEPNTQQRFYIDMERVHLFEQGETGRNLTLSAESVAAT